MRVQTRRRHRDSVLLSVVSLLLLGNLVRLGLTLWPTHAAALSPEPTPAAPVINTTLTYSATPTTDIAEAVAHVDAVTQVCGGTRYNAPGSIDLTTRQAGLTTVVDQPTYYVVQAADLTTLRQRIVDCPYRSAAGPYQGFTTYRLSWQYKTTLTSEGLCSLSGVKIGMHVNQLLPQLSSSDPTLAADLTAFMNNLHAHEQGHITIDMRYAQQLTDMLTGLGAMNCSSIDTQAQLTINTVLTQLNAANDLYDSTTDHGATQGASL